MLFVDILVEKQKDINSEVLEKFSASQKEKEKKIRVKMVYL